jgi:GldL N-terminal domain
MQKKYLLPLIVFLIGMIITIIGSLFKIMHWPGASIMLIIGMLSEATALIILIVTILKKK